MHAAKYYKNQTALNLFFQRLLRITISFKSQQNNKCFNHLLKSPLADGISYIAEAKEIEHITLPEFAMHDCTPSSVDYSLILIH